MGNEIRNLIDQRDDREGAIEIRTRGLIKNSDAAKAIEKAIKNGDTPRTAAEWGKYYRGVNAQQAQLLSEVHANATGTRMNLNNLKKTTQSDLNDIRTKNQKMSSGEVRKVGSEARNALKSEAEMERLNKELIIAWTRNLQGGLFKRGLAGLFADPRRSLGNALEKYDTATQERIVNSIKQHGNTAYNLEKGIAGGKKELAWALSPLGYKSQAEISQALEDPNYNSAVKGRLKDALGVLGVFAISSALGSPSLYVGDLALPFNVQTIKTPSKDVAAYALFGTMSAAGIKQAASQLHNKYMARAGALSDSDIVANRGKMDEYDDQLIDNAQAIAGSYGANMTGESNMWNWGKKMRAQKLMNESVNIDNKYNPGDTSPAQKEINSRILDTKYLYMMQNGGRNDRELASLLSQRRISSTSEFLATFQLPNNCKAECQKYLQGFFEGKGATALDWGDTMSRLINSATTQGICDTQGRTGMLTAYKRGGAYLEKYLNTWCSSDGVETQERGMKYGPKMSPETLRNPSLTWQHLENFKPGGTNLYNRYISQIDQLTGVTISKAALQQSVLNSTYDTAFYGNNTGRLQKNIGQLNFYNQPALQFVVPGVNSDGERGYQIFGIKGECTNIVVGAFVPEDSPMIDNGYITIPGRVPIVVGLGGRGGGGKNNGSGETPNHVTTNPGGTNGFGSQAGGLSSGTSYGSSTGTASGGLSPVNNYGR